MNKKTWIVSGIAIALIVAVLVIFQVINRPRVEFTGPERIEDNPRSLPEGVPNPGNFKTQTDVTEFLNKEGRKRGIYKLLAAGANGQIDFYGKLIDQDNNPISGAEVKIRIGQSVPGGGWENVLAQTRTDDNGIFHLSDIRGEHYQIDSVEKPGYLFNSSVKTLLTTSGRSGLPVPETSIDNPWEFRGWKIGEVANIKTIRIGGQIIPDGRPYTIKLTDNSPSKMVFQEGSDGDITISITRDVTPKGDNWLFYDYNSWTFSLQVKDGGVSKIPATESSGYFYEAPQSGYDSSINVSNNKDSPDWSREFKKHYYIKLSNGNTYGYSKIYVNPFFRKEYADISIRASLNMDGSRNLLSRDEVQPKR